MTATEQKVMEADTSVKVAVRIRPLLEHEISQQCSTCLHVRPSSSEVCIHCMEDFDGWATLSSVATSAQITVGADQNFTFDYVYGMDSAQADVMEECVMPLVDGM